MATVSIHIFASENVDNIDKAYSCIEQTTDVAAFDQHLNDKLQSSINLSHGAFTGSVQAGKYLSAYEFLGAANEDGLKKHFGPKYPYRIPFDSLFNEGNKMKYFALNSGNMGMPTLWGRYCMVFKLTYFDNDKTAVLRQNSLARKKDGQHYYFNDKAPDAGRIKSEMCTLGQARQQCVIKKHSAVTGMVHAQYPDVVCNSKVKPKVFRDADYVELLTTQDCVLNKNYTVRMTEKEYDLIFTATFDSYGAGALGAGKKPIDREADEFVKLYSDINFDIETVA